MPIAPQSIHTVLQVVFILFLFPLSANGQDQWKNVYTESAWSERDAWQRAPELIKSMGLKSGATAADIGCHEGYMTVKLADAVGTLGKVFAVDLEAHKLERLKVNLDKRQITQVTAVLGEAADPKLPEKSLDAVIILDTYHEIRDHQQVLSHIRAALKPNGRLVICEPIAEERKGLTREEQERKHEIGLKFVLEDLKNAGFKILKKEDLFADRRKEKGDIMWLVVATSVP